MDIDEGSTPATAGFSSKPEEPQYYGKRKLESTPMQREHLAKARAMKRQKADDFKQTVFRNSEDIDLLSQLTESYDDRLTKAVLELSDVKSEMDKIKRKASEKQILQLENFNTPTPPPTTPLLESSQTPPKDNPVNPASDITGNFRTVASLGVTIAAIYAGNWLAQQARSRMETWIPNEPVGRDTMDQDF